MSGELKVCTFKWGTKFHSQHVNVLFSMVKRNCTLPFEAVCITDDARGLDADIRHVPLWSDFADVKSPVGHSFPSCYRRLKLFGPDASKLIGERIVCMDIDTVIVDDMTPLWDRDDEFMIWANCWGKRKGKGKNLQRYNGSMFMLSAGARPQVWSRFNPTTSPREATRAGHRGSDQGWLSHVLPDSEATWSKADGVFSFRIDIYPEEQRSLPLGARVVFWHGQHNPWDGVGQSLDWVREHYR
jgi:hypothetical protein